LPLDGIDEITETWPEGDCVFDYDGDGDLDVYTSRHAADSAQLFSNDGDGSFTEVHAGLFAQRDRHGCATADVNLDGLPDLYVTIGACRGTCDASNELWIQQPDHSFVHVASALGVQDTDGRGRGAVFLDANGDEYPDLFVTNAVGTDRPSPNRLFLGGAEFAESSGLPNEEIGSRCVDAADFDQDGDDDIVVCSTERGLVMYENTGGDFVDATDDLGVPSWGRVDAEFADMNGDGALDLLTTGRDRFEVRLQTDGRFPNLDFFIDLDKSRHAAAGDIDGDLDNDVYIVQGDNDEHADVLLFNNGDGRDFTLGLPEPATGGDGDAVQAIPDWDGSGRAAFLVTNGYQTTGPRQLITFEDVTEVDAR